MSKIQKDETTITHVCGNVLRVTKRNLTARHFRIPLDIKLEKGLFPKLLSCYVCRKCKVLILTAQTHKYIVDFRKEMQQHFLEALPIGDFISLRELKEMFNDTISEVEFDKLLRDKRIRLSTVTIGKGRSKETFYLKSHAERTCIMISQEFSFNQHH